MTIAEPWYIGSWLEVVDRPETVDEAFERNDEYAGVALLALVLNHPEAEVVLPRIKRALGSPRPQNRANALQCVGHYSRLHASIDHELVALLRRALSDRTQVDGFGIRGHAGAAADDVGMFAPRRRLPRWFRRRFPGPRRSSRW
ncbi:hypothetical protein Q0Z83_045280 [Actinoplanes sichuanensis]|uniref:HEAT repeat domain-containing protein n=1 Tax=Actinoplanes sichuanensis TaxID=512349 RepID=A0ABW4AAB0_9ACTN|nr:hypothetical protein [Actinoplanes sichuanensis]BEL06337.1 hypothetical protein Q0Z83_045280 [Actinoplanes sichuanensis]